MTMKSLEGRFFDFLSRIDGAESLDEGVFQKRFGESRKADYLLRNRKVVVEVKTLKIDPAHKVEERLALHKNRPEFPLYYWQSELSEILPHLPDGEEVRNHIFHALTNSVQKAVRSANDQIHETKKILKLTNSCGVLVILNDSVGILRPDYVTAKANGLILQERNGVLRFPEIAYVWIFSESHSLRVKGGPEGLPIILLEGPRSDEFKEVGDYLSSLNERWARASRSPLFQWRVENFEGSKFDSRAKPSTVEKKRHLSNQELWRLAYKMDPYLRNLPESDFLSSVGRIFISLAPNFILGREKLSPDRLAQLTIAWTHALEEAEYRRLDMRKLRRYIDRRQVPEDLIDRLLHHLSKLSWGRDLEGRST